MSLEAAIKLARSMEYEKGKQRIAAVICDKGGNVVSYATNSYTKTHPVQKKYACLSGSEEKQFLHAEISAIIRSRCDLKDHTIFVARVLHDGTPAYARPCDICLLAIKESGIKKVNYTMVECNEKGL